jgi:hypothetical protein
MVMADEQPLSRRDLRRQVERLHEEMLRLQRQIAQQTGLPVVEVPAPDFESLQGKDVDALLVPMNRALADLAFAVNQLKGQDRPAKPSMVQTERVEASDVTYRVQMPEGAKNRSVRIANVGSDIVVHPRLIVNEKHNWFSTTDILNDILKPEMNDRDRALSIWRFLVDHRYHDEPAHSDIEMHDPVRFLNVYGYGFCDDSATNFMVLAERAGLQARVWGLSGHVVPEAFFDDAWHMLDPDGEIYYLDDDGETISSVATLEKRPDIIRKYPSPFYTQAEKLVAIYTTTEDNKVSDWYPSASEAKHKMAYVLRPGESLTRHFSNWGCYFASPYLAEPKRYANGEFVFEPVWEDDTYKKGAKVVHQLQVERVASNLALVSMEDEGVIIYHFVSPYPYLDGRVIMAGEGDVAIAISEMETEWADVWHSKVGKETLVPLRGHFRNGHGRPMYSFYLRLTLTGMLRQLRFEYDIQVAPLSLPTLEPGENGVRYLDGSGIRHMEIGFAYDLESTNP